MNYFLFAAMGEVVAGRLTPEFYQKLRDAEEAKLDEPVEDEADTDGFYSCNCGDKCRC